MARRWSAAVWVAGVLAAGALLSAGGSALAGDPPAAKPDELIRAWRDATEPAAAQAAGKKILKALPDDAAALDVLLKFVKEGWTVPKLQTSHATLRGWAFDKVDGQAQPDVRLALLELIERDQPGSPLVKDGGILYTKSWCHWAAKRYAQAIEIGEKYVTRFPKGSNVDDARWTVAARPVPGRAPTQPGRRARG